MAEYTLQEMMTIVAAKEIRNNEIVFCGTGVSMLASMAAKYITAPDVIMFFETGAIDVQFEQTPLSAADPRLMHGAIRLAGLGESFHTMQNRFTGSNIVGVLGAAQIDMYGNLNSTSLGDYLSPKIRFCGSGGGCDVGSLVGRTILFMELGREKFVPRVDYITTPGFLDGGDARVRAGLPGNGPSLVVTNRGSFRFDDQTKKMYLFQYYPGIDPLEIQDQISFDIDLSRATEAQPPTAEELDILRNKCDPERLFLKSR